MDMNFYFLFFNEWQNNPRDYISLEHELSDVPEEVLTNLTIEGYELGETYGKDKEKPIV